MAAYALIDGSLPLQAPQPRTCQRQRLEGSPRANALPPSPDCCPLGSSEPGCPVLPRCGQRPRIGAGTAAALRRTARGVPRPLLLPVRLRSCRTRRQHRPAAGRVTAVVGGAGPPQLQLGPHGRGVVGRGRRPGPSQPHWLAGDGRGLRGLGRRRGGRRGDANRVREGGPGDHGRGSRAGPLRRCQTGNGACVLLLCPRCCPSGDLGGRGRVPLGCNSERRHLHLQIPLGCQHLLLQLPAACRDRKAQQGLSRLRQAPNAFQTRTPRSGKRTCGPCCELSASPPWQGSGQETAWTGGSAHCVASQGQTQRTPPRPSLPRRPRGAPGRGPRGRVGQGSAARRRSGTGKARAPGCDRRSVPA